MKEAAHKRPRGVPSHGHELSPRDKFLETESRREATRGWAGSGGELVFNRDECLFGGHGKLWKGAVMPVTQHCECTKYH